MGAGTYIFRLKRPPGKGWKLVCIIDGYHWLNRLWWKKEGEA